MCSCDPCSCEGLAAQRFNAFIPRPCCELLTVPGVFAATLRNPFLLNTGVFRNPLTNFNPIRFGIL